METGHATLMVRHGGKIQRSSDGGRRTYDGGLNKLVKVRRSASLLELHDRLAAVAGCFKVALYYVRPDDPDTLRDVVTDDDVRHVLSWVLLRDLLRQLYGATNPEKVIPRVRVFVVSMDVRQPLPEWLFAVAPTTPIAAPSSSLPAPPSKATMSPSSLRKRSVSAPSLSAYSANDTSRPPSPSRMQRSASASRLTPPSTKPMTTTTAAAASTLVTPEDIRHYAAPSPAAMHRSPSLAYPAPVFLVPVYPSSPPKRTASAPSLSAYSANDTSNPPSPSLIQRSASASRLTPPSTNPIRTTTAAASESTHGTQEAILHYAAPFPAAMQSGPAPVFLGPVAPTIVYQVIPVIPVYQGFLVPAGCNVVVLCAA